MTKTKTKVAEPVNGRTDRLADDLLSGVAAIAEFRGESWDRTYHLLTTGGIPGWRHRRRWYARRSSLIRQAAELEAEAVAERNGRAA